MANFLGLHLVKKQIKAFAFRISGRPQCDILLIVKVFKKRLVLFYNLNFFKLFKISIS